MADKTIIFKLLLAGAFLILVRGEEACTCLKTPGFLNSFTEYMHLFHKGRDFKQKYTRAATKDGKIKECQQWCLEEPKCKAYELHIYDGRCTIEAINKWDRALESHTSYVYFNRDYDCGCPPCKGKSITLAPNGTQDGSKVFCINSANGKKSTFECNPCGWKLKETC